jgi:hypothetical protein
MVMHDFLLFYGFTFLTFQYFWFNSKASLLCFVAEKNQPSKQKQKHQKQKMYCGPHCYIGSSWHCQ